MDVPLVQQEERGDRVFVRRVPEAEAEVSEPVLSDYLRLTKTSHEICVQRFHQGIDFIDERYAPHGHVIRDDWDEEEKRQLADHIEAFHKGGKVDG